MEWITRSTYPCSFFERRSDATLKEHESKFNFKSDCSPVANQSSKPIAITQEGTAAADDLDIKACACVQYPILSYPKTNLTVQLLRWY